MKVGITGVAIQPCSLMCLEVIFEGIDHQQLLTYCASDTEALWYLSSDVPAVEMLECQWFMLTFYSCWLFCLLSVCWICHISCLSVECSKVNRIKHSFKSKQAKKNSKRYVFRVVVHLIPCQCLHWGKKAACIHKIGRSLSCKASVRLAAFKRGWTIEYRFTKWLVYILVLCIQTMKNFMDMVCSDEVVFQDVVVLFGHWSLPSKLSSFVKLWRWSCLFWRAT